MMNHRYKDPFNILHFIKKIDFFGEPIPAFNLAGREVIKTMFGAFTSLSILAITFAFASMKYTHLIERRNPTININKAALASDLQYSTGSDDFMLAFATESYRSKEILTD